MSEPRSFLPICCLHKRETPENSHPRPRSSPLLSPMKVCLLASLLLLCFGIVVSGNNAPPSHPSAVTPKCPCVRICLRTDAINCLMKCLATNENCKDANVTDIMEFVTVRARIIQANDEDILQVVVKTSNGSEDLLASRRYAGYAAAAFAKSKIGYPYTTNHADGFGPSHYDCTGLVYSAWKHAGFTDVPTGIRVVLFAWTTTNFPWSPNNRNL